MDYVKTCTVDDCDSLVHGRGLCNRHYRRQLKHGDVRRNDRSRPIAERLWEKVDKSGECWLWTGSRGCTLRGDYGKISYEGRTTTAHRAAYLIEVGPIPDGWDVDHLCRNRLCVRPGHLEAVPHRVNVQRGYDHLIESGEWEAMRRAGRTRNPLPQL